MRIPDLATDPRFLAETATKARVDGDIESAESADRLLAALDPDVADRAMARARVPRPIPGIDPERRKGPRHRADNPSDLARLKAWLRRRSRRRAP